MLRDIKVLHLEPTDVCQAACSLCARETDVDFDQSQQHHLDMHKIQQVFAADRISMLDKMFMCGNYGDPAAGKHTLNICKEFRTLNPNIVLGMNTNGALQNTVWWNDLGRLFNQSQDYVVFSIDGLEDTNEIYRKNVSWSKLMSNIRAFVEAGGSAHWDMLVYEHNQHQVEQCEQLARDLGFSWFRAKVSRRPFTKKLKQPIGWQLPQTHSTNIKCRVLVEQSAYIDAQGRHSPCCWLGARQSDFITDIKIVQNTWTSDQPNLVCLSTCGSSSIGSSFLNQWQREISLC